VGDGAVKPFYVQVHQRDNVAIIANPEGLPAGTYFSNGLTRKERIPQSHKVALQHLQRGDPIQALPPGYRDGDPIHCTGFVGTRRCNRITPPARARRLAAHYRPSGTSASITGIRV
jgi:hypothetical protein